MAVDWSRLTSMIDRSHHILLMTHVRPDADGLGSQLALADGLRSLGKQPRVVIASSLPPRYAFLNQPEGIIERFHAPGEEFRAVDLIIIMDTGTWNQIGEFGPFLKSMTVPKVVVDHHRTQDDLGADRFVDVTAEATGRLAYQLLQALGVSISSRAAHHLFMAVALDTGWFRHSNTTAETFRLAETLVKLGANPTPLYEQLFEDSPLPRVKLVGRALERLEVRCGGRVAFTEVYLNDYTVCGAVPGDTEDLINYPRSIAGVEVALLFIEQPEGDTKVSFRSRKLDVSKLAERFGGGGHQLAAGARVNAAIHSAREQVLSAVSEALSPS
jgi:phosphoesterase RecJ-like protein